MHKLSVFILKQYQSFLTKESTDSRAFLDHSFLSKMQNTTPHTIDKFRNNCGTEQKWKDRRGIEGGEDPLIYSSMNYEHKYII